MTEYFAVTQDILDMAQSIITNHHPELAEVNINFVFRDEAPINSSGFATLGQACKVAPKYKPVLEYDFWIWIAKDRWHLLNPIQKQALIDHELCHCKYDPDEEKVSMRPHDIEEFQEIIDRYGLWSVSLQMAQPALEKAIQMEMPTFVRTRVVGSLTSAPEKVPQAA